MSVEGLWIVEIYRVGCRKVTMEEKRSVKSVQRTLRGNGVKPELTHTLTTQIVTKEEKKREQKRKDKEMEEAARLRPEIPDPNGLLRYEYCFLCIDGLPQRIKRYFKDGGTGACYSCGGYGFIYVYKE